MLKDYIDYVRGCRACQMNGPMQHVPATELNPIAKPWPFRAWDMNLIGMIYLPSSRQHRFIVVTRNYFTKWVKAIPMKSID